MLVFTYIALRRTHEYCNVQRGHADFTTVVYFQDHFCYQEGNAMSHYARIVFIFLQQEGIT